MPEKKSDFARRKTRDRIGKHKANKAKQRENPCVGWPSDPRTRMICLHCLSPVSGEAQRCVRRKVEPKPHRSPALALTLGLRTGRKQAGRARPDRIGRAKDDRPTQQRTLNSGGGREGWRGAADQGRETPTPLVCCGRAREGGRRVRCLL